MTPFERLDLRLQKVTLPLEGSDGKVLEIKRPELDSYEHPDWFYAEDDGVHFKSRVDAFTTANSTYPRCELREMADETGDKLAAWSSTSGEHTLWMRFAVLEAPPVKTDVVVFQIHDGSNDVVQAMYRGKGTPKGLVWRFNGTTQERPLINPFTLATWANLKCLVKGGRVKIYANLLPTMDFTNAVKIYDHVLTKSGLYFRAGDYVQSNTTKGDAPDAVGHVVISDLRIKHV